VSSSNPKLEVQGTAPFNQSGVFEVSISISEKKPSEDSINSKSFPTLWNDNYHLRVKDGQFTETLGDNQNPIPEKIFNLDSVWIVVSDQFSSLHSSFEVNLSGKKPAAETRAKKTTEKPTPKTTSSKQTVEERSTIGAAGPTGPSGEKAKQVLMVLQVTKVLQVHKVLLEIKEKLDRLELLVAQVLPVNLDQWVIKVQQVLKD